MISEGRFDAGLHSFASLNTVGMGDAQAEGVAKALGGKGNIVILQGVPAPAGVQNLDGMKQVLAKYPRHKVLTTQYTDWSRDKGKSAMENALRRSRISTGSSATAASEQRRFEVVKAAGRLDEIKAGARTPTSRSCA